MPAAPNLKGPKPPAMPAQLRQALQLLEAGENKGAHLAFTAAYQQEPQNPLVASYYGLSCALVLGPDQKALTLCSWAARHGLPDPVLWLNLAKVQAKLGKVVDAVKALEKGLKLKPRHPEIVAFWGTLGKRRKPPVPFLRRGNPLNRALGKLSYGRKKKG
jgi:predicted Zn-dependent protease